MRDISYTALLVKVSSVVGALAAAWGMPVMYKFRGDGPYAVSVNIGDGAKTIWTGAHPPSNRETLRRLCDSVAEHFIPLEEEAPEFEREELLRVLNETYDWLAALDPVDPYAPGV